MSRHPRHQAIITRHSDENIGEDHWYRQLEKNLQKDAVQPRSQDSLFDQINSIMNGNRNAKYQSVEAAVEDMKERSGLTAYLSKVKVASDETAMPNIEELANINKFVDTKNSKDKDQIALKDQLDTEASKQDWYNVGFLQGKFDKKYNEVGPAAKAINDLKFWTDPKLVPPIDKWVHYTMGYTSGADLPESEFRADMERTRKLVEQIKMKKKASDNNSAIDKKVNVTPIVIKKHPPVMKTLENYVNDTKGNLPVPAIIEKIRSIHRTDCSDAKDWDDDNLIRLVSKLNLKAKSVNPATYENHSDLGVRDIGSESEIDPSNTDAFFALMPAKI